MLKKKIGSVILLMGLSGVVVVAAGSAALQPRIAPRAVPLASRQSPDILALPWPLWDAIEQFSPFFVGTSLVSIGALLRTRKKRDGGGQVRP